MSHRAAQTICEDLLYLIFLHALPLVVHGDGSLININTVEPMNFSMVCHSWRATVLSHSDLWGYVVIQGYSDRPVQTSLRRFLSKWLEHSQASLLSIRLRLHGQGDEEDEIIRGIIKTTTTQYSRLKDVDIFVENPFTSYIFSLPFAPSLLSVKLSCVATGYNVIPPSTSVAYLDFTSCAVSAKLWRLSVSQGVRWILPKYPYQTLHFPNLSNLDICTDLTGIDNDFHAVLVACPNIVDLSVHARHCVYFSPSSISNAVDLPRLTDLYIASENRAATLQLLAWLRCPSLRALRVIAPNLEDRNPEEHCMTTSLLIAYGDFFTRSQPPILSLSLTYPSTPSDYDGHGLALRNMLRPLRTLEALLLKDIVIDSELFEEMMFHDRERSEDFAICPLLKIIQILHSPHRKHDFSCGAHEC